MRTRSAHRRLNKNGYILLATIALVMTLLLTAGIATNAKEERTMYKYYDSYMVEKGDTLSSIAREFNSAYCSDKQIKDCIEEMMTINSLDHKGTIVSGNYIMVTYYSEEYK